MNIKLLTLALMVAGATSACSPETFERNLANIEDFGNPPEEPQEPSREAAKPVNEPEDVNPDPPVNVPVLNEHQRWQTDPTYTCVAEFGHKSCTDWGEPVWLDDQRGWLPFGEVRERK